MGGGEIYKNDMLVLLKTMNLKKTKMTIDTHKDLKKTQTITLTHKDTKKKIHITKKTRLDDAITIASTSETHHLLILL